MHVTNFMTSFFCLCCFQWDISYFLFVVLVTSETSLCLFTYSSSPSFSPLVCCSKETTVRFYICSKCYFSSLSFLLHFLQLLAGISIRALQFLFTLYVQFWDMIAVQFLDGYCLCSFKKKKKSCNFSLKPTFGRNEVIRMHCKLWVYVQTQCEWRQA